MTDRQAQFQSACDLENIHDRHAKADALAQLQVVDGAPKAEVQFHVGHTQFHLGDLEAAARHISEAIQLNPNNARWHFRLGYIREKQQMLTLAVEQYQAALQLEPGHTRWQHRLDSVLEANQRQREAERTEQAEARSSFKQRLMRLKEDKAPKWQELDALSTGRPLFKDDPDWLSRLGDALFFMNRFSEAAQELEAASQLRPEDAELHFKAGWAHHLIKAHYAATQCFQRAIEADKVLDSARFGIGAFFQKKGQWRLAADHYEQVFHRNPTDAAVAYRWGFALQRCYDWQGGGDAIRTALRLSPAEAQWHYRLGFSMERLGMWQAAADSYAHSIQLTESSKPYWCYRLGSVLAKNGHFEAACAAFAQMKVDSVASQHTDVDTPVSEDSYLGSLLVESLDTAEASQSPSLCQDLGDRAYERGMVELAAKAYRAATARSTDHSATLYYRLAFSLAASGRYEEAVDAYLNTRLLRAAHGVDTSTYLRDKFVKASMIYVEYLESLNIEDDVILYESNHGGSATCNPLALFRHIVSQKRFENITHVWVLNDPKTAPPELIGRPNVIFARRDSDLYLRYLASAKYLINNNTFPPYFSRREEQQYLNTWHGTPMKTLGRDIKSGFMEHKNAARNFLHATHIIAPNEFTAGILLDKYDVQGIFRGKVAVTGYPRIDATYQRTEDKRVQLKRELGLTDARKVILYAPTWRGTLSGAKLDASAVTQAIGLMTDGGEHDVLFRGHPITETSLLQAGVDTRSVPAWIDTNDLLAVVDVLVTDYSSIAFDFMATGNPVIYYAYDLEEYESERGLYFDMNDLPGTVCLTPAELSKEICRSTRRATTERQEADPRASRFVHTECGESTRRAVEFFFDSSDEFVRQSPDSKHSVLLYQGSFIPNGVTSSYLNLLSSMSSGVSTFYLAIDPSAVSKDESRLEKFAENPAHVRVLARVGTHLISAEERWIVDKFNAMGTFSSGEQENLYKKAFSREFRRLYGSAEFDVVVCFEGYVRFWAALFAYAPGAHSKKAIFLHSDMRREWESRFKYLETIFRLYGEYDALVSVTRSVSEENKKNLSVAFDLPSDRFVHNNNLVNANRILSLAGMELDEDLRSWFHDDWKVFVTVGRLSPEKGHAKLIRGFAKVSRAHKDIRLIIVGDGPLKNDLMQLISELGLTSSVLLAGSRSNPFSIVSQADCFVFSSDYEGQGIAVLEALILGKPAISTDVVGPRSILEGGFGLLVENSSDGLEDGMKSFLSSTIPQRKFDYVHYQSEAVQSFKHSILSLKN